MRVIFSIIIYSFISLFSADHDTMTALDVLSDINHKISVYEKAKYKDRDYVQLYLYPSDRRGKIITVCIDVDINDGVEKGKTTSFFITGLKVNGDNTEVSVNEFAISGKINESLNIRFKIGDKEFEYDGIKLGK